MDSSYSKPEILQAERYILESLDWNLNYPNPIHLLRRIGKADQFNVQTRIISKHLMEMNTATTLHLWVSYGWSLRPLLLW